MKHSHFTGTRPRVAGITNAGMKIAGLMFAILAASVLAQAAASAARPYYDVRQEVTLSGTVSSVVTKPTPALAPGSHLLLNTASGAVDAFLGNWAMAGKGALSVSAGQSVEVTGVMKTLKNRQVFVVRTVKTGSHVYVVRNEFGIPESPQSRQRASQNAAPKGVSQ